MNKLYNMVLDLKKVEASESIEDLLNYEFENLDYTNKTKITSETLEDYENWLEYQSSLILRLERDIIRYLKEKY